MCKPVGIKFKGFECYGAVYVVDVPDNCCLMEDNGLVSCVFFKYNVLCPNEVLGVRCTNKVFVNEEMYNELVEKNLV